MKKILGLISIFILIIYNSYSQQTASSDYFPTEQLILGACAENQDPNKCLTEIILKKVNFELLKLNQTYQTYKDTLKINVQFTTDIKGNVSKRSTTISINDSIIKKQISKDLTASINQFPSFIIKNRKSDNYPSYHIFNFYYKNTDAKILKQIEIPKDLIYDGGKVKKIPMFKNCKYKSDSKDKICFQNKIEKHVIKHFNYPDEAKKKGIQGVVYINFIITKNGEIIDLKTKGPHELLEEEAERIINKLEPFLPATANGEPVKIPFSIPITFKLK